MGLLQPPAKSNTKVSVALKETFAEWIYDIAKILKIHWRTSQHQVFITDKKQNTDQLDIFV